MEEDESDYCQCYYADHNAKSTALNLLTFGNEHFKKVTHISKIDQLEDIIGNYQVSNKQAYWDAIQPFVFENLIDAIKISICFENYTKAKLLLKGFVIHRISDKPLYKKFKKKQASQPIELNEILNIEGWKDVKDKAHYLPGLSKRTIAYSTILNKSGYQEHIALLPNVKRILSEINRQRNRLHFLEGEIASYSKSRIHDLKTLIDFVQTDLIILQNELVEELGLPDEKKIKK